MPDAEPPDEGEGEEWGFGQAEGAEDYKGGEEEEDHDQGAGQGPEMFGFTATQEAVGSDGAAEGCEDHLQPR
ncbi:hypothetical protein DKK74_07190 [Bifidobacterium asteroides]|uniref:Uncharacterized protein n=1 Tax=Bifidobacterium asteroides TaxID=1684 RepID=A0A318N0S0_9BIFI|nr:hypothetical protein DKK74_07190 [Bifidobacterium asteroides]